MFTSEYEFKRNLAIIIGINEYSNGIPPLKTPVNDARKLGEILQSTYKYDVQFLLDSQATLEGLNSLLTAFKQKTLPLANETVQVTEKDRVLFYFAGHGIVPADGLENKGDPLGYLVPQDARGDILLQEQVEISKVLLPMQALHDALAELPCRHMLVILDCCFAGAFRSSLYRDIVPARKVFKQRFDRFIRDKAWQALASAAHDQKAIDYLGCFGQRENIGEHSPFAEALFEGLRGAADTTLREGDGIITATELYCYLRDKIEELTEDHHNRQTPGLFQLKNHDKGEYIFLLPDFNQEKLENAPALNPENNPYRGLKSYEEEDSQLFFGRDELVKQLYDRISKPDNPLTVVLGVSGSGKSSIVKAGLVPYLRANYAGQWHIIPTIRPGESPFTALAEAVLRNTDPTSADKLDSINTLSDTLKQAPKQFINVVAQSQEVSGDVKLLLVIDQFEELITICKQQEREQFLNFLAQVVDAYPQQLRLVLTLRSDFEPRFLDSALKSHWTQGTQARFPVRAMRSDELRQAIERPASEKMLDFDPPNLVDQLIDEVGQMPGALSLLSFTLSELYIKCIERESRTLSKIDYDALEGVAGSLTHRATEEYNKLDEAQRLTMRRVMERMVTIKGGGFTRRRVSESELVYPDPQENERVKQVSDQLVNARLLVKGQEPGEPLYYVEPAHDYLVRGWGKLPEWVDADKEKLILHQRLTLQANDWAEGAVSPTLDTSYLNLLEETLSSDRLNQREKEFIETNREQAQASRIKENLQGEATLPGEATKVSQLIIDRPLAGLLLATRTMKQNLEELPEEIIESVATGLYNAMIDVRVLKTFRGHEQGVLSVAFSPDGKKIVSGSRDNILRLWDLEGKNTHCFKGDKEGKEGHKEGKEILSVAFSPDGKKVVSSGGDGTVRLWDIGSGKQIQLISIPSKDDKIEVRTVVWNHKFIVSGATDGFLHFWNSKGQPVRETFEAHKDRINSIVFSQNGEIMVTASKDKYVRGWNLKGETIKELFWFQCDGEATSVAFSPDGNSIVIGDESKTLYIFDFKVYELCRKKKIKDGIANDRVYSVAFRTDNIIVCGCRDGTVLLWNLQTDSIDTWRGHTNEVRSLAISVDGNIISSGVDKVIHLWDTQDNLTEKSSYKQNWKTWFDICCKRLQHEPEFKDSPCLNLEKICERGKAKLKRRADKFRQTNLETAVKIFELIIQFNATCSDDAYYHRGLAYRELGDEQMAVSDIQKAAELYQQQGKEQEHHQALVALKQIQ